MLKRLGLSLAIASLLLGSGPAFAVPPNISYTTGVCDPSFGTRCIKPNADGSINTSSGGAAATFTPAQVSVATSATLIAAARTVAPARKLLIVVNTTTTAVYVGGSGVTTSTGLLLPGVVGASLTVPYTGALYGIVASGSATVTEAETY